MKTIPLTICLIFFNIYVFSQTQEKLKAFENYHNVSATLKMAKLSLLLGGIDKNQTVFMVTNKDYQQYSDAGTYGNCENGIYLSTVTVKINDNLIYVLSAGTVTGLESNYIKIMLSSISDGETTNLLNGIYRKERYISGTNEYLEVIRIGRGAYESDFSIFIKDYQTLYAFSLPNVIVKGSGEQIIFQLYENFNPCIN